MVADCIPRSALLGSGSPVLGVRLTGKKTVFFIPAGRCLSFLSHPFLRARGSRTLPFLMRAASKPFSDWEDPEMIASASTYRSLPVFLFTPGRGNVVTVERSGLR